MKSGYLFLKSFIPRATAEKKTTVHDSTAPGAYLRKIKIQYMIFVMTFQMFFINGSPGKQFLISALIGDIIKTLEHLDKGEVLFPKRLGRSRTGYGVMLSLSRFRIIPLLSA